jgi:hypothetical protein
VQEATGKVIGSHEQQLRGINRQVEGHAGSTKPLGLLGRAPCTRRKAPTQARCPGA